MKLRHLFLVLLLGFVLAGCGPSSAALPVTAVPTPAPSFTVSSEDEAAIRQAALDYVEGWYAADADRMERALHADFVKRVIMQDRVVTSRTSDMVNYTRQGGGASYAGEKKNVVTILDVYNDIATVRAESAEYIDYLHIGKVKGKWVLINALWTYKQPK